MFFSECDCTVSRLYRRLQGITPPFKMIIIIIIDNYYDNYVSNYIREFVPMIINSADCFILAQQPYYMIIMRKKTGLVNWVSLGLVKWSNSGEVNSSWSNGQTDFSKTVKKSVSI